MTISENKAQHQAIHHDSGPLLIVAGAGTGKTTVITQKIKHLIEDKHTDPYHIFAATFTEKSAEEMRARLDLILPFGYQEPWLGTFHGLCERILAEEGLEIGLNPHFKILNTVDQWMLLREHLYDLNLNYYLPLGNPTKFISALIKFFSRLADDAITPESFNKLVTQKKRSAATSADEMEVARLHELNQVWQHYQQLKHDQAALDFGDLITKTLDLFTTRPNLLAKYQAQFEYILVDEFQDTNRAQFELIKLLAPSNKNPNLTVVGDDDQSIYKFRGASVSNILEFTDIYPQAEKIVLTQNYRSSQAILDAAYQSIIHNNPDRLEVKLKLNKKLIAQFKYPEKPEIVQFDTIEDEVDWTIKRILELVTKENLTYQNISILARNNAQLDPYVIALKTAGIPFQLVANRGLFDQPEIKTLIHFLKVLADPTDTISVFELTQSFPFTVKPTLMFDLIVKARKQSIPLWEIIKQETDPSLTNLVEIIDRFQVLASTHTVSQLLYLFLNQVGYVKPLIENDSIQNQLALKNINLFFNQLKRFETNAENKSLLSFLTVLDLWLEAGENPGQSQIEDIDTVNLMTIHSAKGLEFDAVFIANVIAGRFPGSNRKDLIEVPVELSHDLLPEGDANIEEERRLFYVGLTRAKRFLTLTWPEDVGGLRKRKASGFLAETNLPVKKIDNVFKQHLTTKPPAAPPAHYLKEGKFIIDTVSFSQIKTFTDCPLKYKYSYLLHIPTKTHHAATFGQSIHQTLLSFHQYQIKKQPVSLKLLESLYQDNFIDEGYDNQKHRDARFKSGLAAMKQYFDQYQSIFGKPVLLEQSFRLKLPSATLTGKIDRVDQLPDGTYEIIDYKTGSHKDQKHADKDEQLTIYALAANEALKLPVSAVSFYYLEPTPQNPTGEKITTTRSDVMLKKAKTKLDEKIQNMQQSDFKAKPDPVTCGFCEYQPICPFASNKRGI